MKQATVREVQHGLASVLAEVERGREVVVTKRGRIVARIVPPRTTPTAKHWPDFAGRMRTLFPNGVPAGDPASKIIGQMRDHDTR